MLLFVHHAVQPLARKDVEAPNRRTLTVASRVVSWVFVLLVGFWFAFYQVMEMVAAAQPRLVEALVSDVQRKISVPAYVLLPFAGAAVVYQVIIRSKAQSEA
jgi:hypothetical protein